MKWLWTSVNKSSSYHQQKKSTRSRDFGHKRVLNLEQLEKREVPAVLPGQIVSFASFLDGDGDTVSLRVTGPILNSVNQGFTVELAGLAVDNADAHKVTLSGLTKDNGLEVIVTPNVLIEQPSPTGKSGDPFATIYSSGYTNIYSIETTASSIKTIQDYNAALLNPPMTDLGSIYLSAAIVNRINLGGVSKVEGTSGIEVEVPKLGAVSIKNDITLDCGQVPFVDRINTQNRYAIDSTMYNPASGLIYLGGLSAKNVGAIVINGVISADTKNPFDTATTNDFRGVIEVEGSIGRIVGLRSNMRATVRADSINSVRVASIAGEITTRNKTSDLAINFPNGFSGFVNSAGHLHMGFPLSDGAKITGQIQALGISGNDTGSYTDPLNIPGTFAGSIQVTGGTLDRVGWYASHPEAVGNFPDINVDGIAGFGLTANHGNIGSIQSDGYDALFVAISEEGSIGNLDAGSGGFEGHVRAKVDVGYLKANTLIGGAIVAGGNIGSISTETGSLEAKAIQAGGNIGQISTFMGIELAAIVAGGDIAGVKILTGGFHLGTIRGRNIGPIEIVDGGMESVSIVASGNVGNVTTFGSFLGFGISDVSIVAAGNIGQILSQTHTGDAIRLLKLEAQGDIVGVTAISYGQLGTLGAGSGIFMSNFVAANIGPVFGRSVGGRGIEESKIITFTARNGNEAPDLSKGKIGLITGLGWLDGLFNVIVVAHSDIAGITGTSIVEGSGISGGSFDANYGNIGPVKGEGGAAAGAGITTTRIQALNVDNALYGNIASITASANANGLDALADSTIYGAKIGPISVTVHGGTNGNGIVRGEIKAFGSDIESINIDVRSTLGMGILDGKISASNDIGPIDVTTLNNIGISGGEFSVRGAFQSIRVEVKKGGTGIDLAKFEALGRIAFWDNPQDPRGNIGDITVITSGKTPESNGIAGSTFNAIGNIGKITAKTMGGTAILDSTFTADSDGDYDPNSTVPGENLGNIAGIYAESAGRNLDLSSAIVGSTFTAANIGNIEARVSTVEGGVAIDLSEFRSKTSVYDGKGNFNNTGTLGNILVDNRAEQNLPGVGAGISKSFFYAGPAGGIGDITVTTRSGIAITESKFDTAFFIDLDQDAFTASIGNITVNAGRASSTLLPGLIPLAPLTTWPAGINFSNFTAPAGIGDITVNSIGSGITLSAFTADFDWTINSRVQGNIGNITVKVPGRNAGAMTLSTFFASNIGNIEVRLTDDAVQGLNAVALSNFTAWAGSIGNVTVIHSQSGLIYNIGLAYAILTSSFTAATGIGAITIEGNTLGAIFIVSGAPVVVRAVRSQFQGIGPVVFKPTGSSSELKLSSDKGFGTITVLGAPQGSTVTLDLTGTKVGDISLESLGTNPASNLILVATCQTLGAVTVDGGLTMTAKNATSIGAIRTGGNASLDLSALQTGASIQVAGMLTLPKGLPSLKTMGVLSAGTVAALNSGPAQIGVVNALGTSIGAINFGLRNTGSRYYRFNFATYTGAPNAVIGSGIVNTVTTKEIIINGVSLVKSAAPTAVKAPVKAVVAPVKTPVKPVVAPVKTPVKAVVAPVKATPVPVKAVVAPVKAVAPVPIPVTVVQSIAPLYGTKFVVETAARAYGYNFASVGTSISTKVGLQLANIPEAETLELQVLTGLSYWNGTGQPKFVPVKAGVEVNLQVAGQDLRVGEKTDMVGGLNPGQIRRSVAIAVSDGVVRNRDIDVSIGTGGVQNRFAQAGAPNGVYAFTGTLSVRGDSSLGLAGGMIRDSMPVSFVFSVGTTGIQARETAVSYLASPATRPVAVLAVSSELVKPLRVGDQSFLRFYVKFSDPVTVVRNSPLLPVLVEGRQRLVAIEPGTNLTNVDTLIFKMIPTQREIDAGLFEFGKSLQIATGGSIVSANSSLVPILSIPRWAKPPIGIQARTEVISSDIVRNTTFTYGKTYIIEGEIHVRSGITLTIEDGVTVLIRNGQRAIRNITTSALIFDSGSRMVAATVTFGSTDSRNLPIAYADNGGVFFCGSTRAGSKDGISAVKQSLRSSFKADRIIATHTGRTDPRGGDGNNNVFDDIDGLSVIGVGESEWNIKAVEIRFSGDDGFDVTNSSITMDELIVSYPVEDGLNISSSLVQVRRNCSIVMSLSNAPDRELFDLEVDNGPSRVVLAREAAVDLRGYWGNIFDEVRLNSPDMPAPEKFGGERHWYVYNGKLVLGSAIIFSINAD